MTADDEIYGEAAAHNRLEKASGATLLTWILVATAILAVYTVIVITGDFDFGVACSALMLPFAVLSIIIAWKLDEAPQPIIELHDKGIALSPAFGSGAQIPWAAIERFRIVHWRYNYILRVPFMTYLCIQLHDSEHIAPHLRLSPMGWFGRIYIPTRFVRGGTHAAKRIMTSAQNGLLNGRIDRDALADGVPRIMANGDAAIARAVAARGGFGNFQARPRTLDDLAYGSDTPTAFADVTPAVAKQRDPEPIPDTIIVNGVPYRPQRPAAGSFGRKRA